MFEGHIFEVIIIAAIALIFLGPKRLPDAGRSLGQAIRGFRDETKGIRNEFAPLKDDVMGIKNEVAGARDSLRSTITESVNGTSNN